MVIIPFVVMHINYHMQHCTECQNMNRLAYFARLLQTPNQNNLNLIYYSVAKNSSGNSNTGAESKKLKNLQYNR